MQRRREAIIHGEALADVDAKMRSYLSQTLPCRRPCRHAFQMASQMASQMAAQMTSQTVSQMSQTASQIPVLATSSTAISSCMSLHPPCVATDSGSAAERAERSGVRGSRCAS
eukprot:6194344-Pleurochrysis_carterae.AAC.1